MTCDEALAAAALGKAGDPATAHLSSCVACQEAGPRAAAVAHLLSSYQVPGPAPGSAARTLAAAAPLLARRRAERRALRRRVAWALTLALLPLPAIVLANVKLLMATHRLLLSLLPPALSLYMVVCLGAGVALLLALSYAAVPLLAARRPRPYALEDRDVHVPA
jgi:hypothetical protein